MIIQLEVHFKINYQVVQFISNLIQLIDLFKTIQLIMIAIQVMINQNNILKIHLQKL